VPPVKLDSSQIHQVIVNLMTNAAHAIGDRPGRIDIRIEAIQIDSEDISPSSKLCEGHYVHLYVADDGCGIDPLNLERIFDPFFTTKPIGQGTGLGLSIVHGIVSKLSGTITVTSTPGKGTAFHIYLPAVERRVEKAMSQPTQAPRPHGERVLYVDDEEALVFLAKNRLERQGCKVTGFTDPGDALREFQRRPGDYDVVVTDISMPHMSGFDLARELLAVQPGVPIVVTTGYVRPEDEAMAEKLGIREIVPKPCRIDDLTGAFERIGIVQPAAVGGNSA
jgi:CheY-like chemotaxis protein